MIMSVVTRPIVLRFLMRSQSFLQPSGKILLPGARWRKLPKQHLTDIKFFAIVPPRSFGEKKTTAAS